jgi:hypothetical protein
MYSLAWRLLLAKGTEAGEKEEDRVGPRQQAYYDARRHLRNMISKYVDKDWQGVERLAEKG